MSFEPGRSADLVCPEPGSTTGRAIASLSLRALNERFAAWRADEATDPRARRALTEFRREMDALLPGRPKARVAVLASPFVRAPLERALAGEEGAAPFAAAAGLFALQLGPGLARSVELEGAGVEVFALEPLARSALDGRALFPRPAEAIERLASWTVGGLLVAPAAAPAFGRVASELTLGARRRLLEASRLLDAGASSEAAELPRFFPLTFPVDAGVERWPGALALPVGDPLSIALDVVEALALEKLERYGKLVGSDVRALGAAARPRVRRALIRRLGRARHPVAETESCRGELAREDEEAARHEVPAEVEGPLGGVAEELSRL